MKPIHITGGGIAGLSLGIFLRERGVPVVLREASSYPRHKVCGEFLFGLDDELRDALAPHGIWQDALHHQTFALSDGQRVVQRIKLPRAALGISRYCLDHRLATAFQSLGGELVENDRQTFHETAGAIWAAGREASDSPWIGLKAHFKGLNLIADLELHSGHGGYAGASRVENGWTNVCGLFRRRDDVKAPRTELLPAYLEACGLGRLAAQLRNAELREGSVCGVTALDLDQAKDFPLPRLGDRWSVIPPYTGNGMALAIRGSYLSTEPLTRYAQGEISWKTAQEHIARNLRPQTLRRFGPARLLHPFFYKSPQRAIFLTLVRLRILPLRQIARTFA